MDSKPKALKKRKHVKHAKKTKNTKRHKSHPIKKHHQMNTQHHAD